MGSLHIAGLFCPVHQPRTLLMTSPIKLQLPGQSCTRRDSEISCEPLRWSRDVRERATNHRLLQCSWRRQQRLLPSYCKLTWMNLCSVPLVSVRKMQTRPQQLQAWPVSVKRKAWPRSARGRDGKVRRGGSSWRSAQLLVGLPLCVAEAPSSVCAGNCRTSSFLTLCLPPS